MPFKKTTAQLTLFVVYAMFGLHALLGGMRSIDRQLLAVPRYRLNTYGCRAFSVAGPRVHSLVISQDLYGTRPSVQTVSDVCLRRICLVNTNAFGALEVLDDYCATLIYLLTYTKSFFITVAVI